MKFCCRKRAKGETAVTATTEEAIFRRAVMRDIIIAETVTQGTMTATSKIHAMTYTDAVTGNAATMKRDAATIETLYPIDTFRRNSRDFTLGPVVICFAVGSAAAAVASCCSSGIEGQLLWFSVATFLAFIAVRPLLLRSFKKGVTGNQEYIKIGNEATSKIATIVHQKR